MATRPKKTPTPDGFTRSGKPRVRYLGDMRRLVLKPGDIVVVITPQPIDVETAKKLSERMHEIMPPGNKCVIFGDPVKIGVMSPGKR